jgi:hypothetical protein
VAVTDVVDHGWAKSIYFRDPNGMSLEYCCVVRNFTQDDATMRERFEVSIEALGLDIGKADEITSARKLHEKARHPG